jgi:glycosyltransferase involved in cell wall biosynthesis
MACGVLRSRLGLPATVPIIGIVARLVAVKDHATLLRAFALVLRAHPDARLVLIGDGPLRDDLAALTRVLGLIDRVHFCGDLDATPALYADLDIFVLSSRAEGTSIALLEAMAAGRCCVATAVGGTPDVLAQGGCGILVATEAPGILADAIIGALSDGAHREALGRAARGRAVAHYSVRRMAEEYLQVYEDALNAP